MKKAAIQKTIEFYELLGIPTKASAYGIGEETVQEIKKRFTDRKVKYGEKSDIDAAATEAILRMSIA